MTTPPPIRPIIRRRRWLPVAAIIIAAGLALLYSIVDPAVTPMPRCPVKMLTGLDCPGCGSQRAIHSLLNGNFIAAWHYNPALILSIPVIIFLLIAHYSRSRSRTIARIAYHPAFARAILAAIILWTIFRNL